MLWNRIQQGEISLSFPFLLFAIFNIYIQLSEKIDVVDVKVATLFESFNLMMDEQKKLNEADRFEELKEWLTTFCRKELKMKGEEEKLQEST